MSRSQSTSLQCIEPIFLLAPVERKAVGLLVHPGALLAAVVPRLVHHPLPLPALGLAPAAHLAVVVLLDAVLHLVRIRTRVGVGVGVGVRLKSGLVVQLDAVLHLAQLLALDMQQLEGLGDPVPHARGDSLAL